MTSVEITGSTYSLHNIIYRMDRCKNRASTLCKEPSTSTLLTVEATVQEIWAHTCFYWILTTTCTKKTLRFIRNIG